MIRMQPVEPAPVTTTMLGIYFYADLVDDKKGRVGDCYFTVFPYSGHARLNSIQSEVPLSIQDVRRGLFGVLKKLYPFVHTVEAMRLPNSKKSKPTRKEQAYQQIFRITND